MPILLLMLATIAPTASARLLAQADAPVVQASPVRLLEIDQELRAMPDAWSTGAKVTAITSFVFDGLVIAATPLFISSMPWMFIGLGAWTLAGVVFIVGVVACIVGAVQLSNARDHRDALLKERETLIEPPVNTVMASQTGVLLASF